MNTREAEARRHQTHYNRTLTNAIEVATLIGECHHQHPHDTCRDCRDGDTPTCHATTVADRLIHGNRARVVAGLTAHWSTLTTLPMPDEIRAGLEQWLASPLPAPHEPAKV